MKSKNSVYYMICASMLAMSVLFSGGCSGGGSKESGDVPTREKFVFAYDGDDDGILDIYDNYPQDSSRHTFKMFKVPVTTKEVALNGNPETAYGRNEPFTAPHTFINTILPPIVSGDEVISSDKHCYAAALVKDRKYSLVFYDMENKGIRAVDFLPTIKIVGEDGREVEYTVKVAMEEMTGAIIVNFKPSITDTHYITINNSVPNVKTKAHPYRFDLINDPDGDGMEFDYTVSGDAKAKYTLRDIIYLRSIMSQYARSWDSDFCPIEFSGDVKDEFNAAVGLVGQKFIAANAPSAEESDLDPTIHGLRWSDKYKLGLGMDAVTGTEAQKEALEPFSLPTNKHDVNETQQVRFVSNKESHERELNVAANLKYNGVEASVQASASYKDNIKYSAMATTMIMDFTATEREYRVLPIKDYKLTAEAAKMAKDNPEKFRESYGDYFISGAKFGVKFLGVVSIQTSSSESTREIEVKLSGSKNFIEGSSEFSGSFKSVASGCSIRMEILKIKGGANVGTDGEFGVEIEKLGWTGSGFVAGAKSVQADPDSIDNLLTEAKKFAKEYEDKTLNFAKTEIQLTRYTKLVGAENLPIKIKYSPEFFAAINVMTREYLGLLAQDQIVKDITVGDLKFGEQTRKKYTDQSAALFTEFYVNRASIYANVDNVKKFTEKVLKLQTELRIFGERYEFFRRMRDVQKGVAWKLEDKEDYIAWYGFNDYLISEAVNNDIDKTGNGKNYPYHDRRRAGSSVGGRHEYDFRWTAGTGRRVVYIYLNINDSQKLNQDNNHPSIGRLGLNYHGIGDYGSSINTAIWAKGINVGNDDANYPFTWM